MKGTLAKRLKGARMAAGLSQEQLGVLAGIDELTAGARVNHYERGRHMPGWPTMCSLAMALDLPVTYFFAKDDDEATLLETYYRMPKKKRVAALKLLASLE